MPAFRHVRGAPHDNDVALQDFLEGGPLYDCSYRKGGEPVDVRFRGESVSLATSILYRGAFQELHL